MLCDIASLLLLATSASAAVAGKKAPAGFVTTQGNVFKLDGKDFYFAGSNAYYFPFNDVGLQRYLIVIHLLTYLSCNQMSKLG